MSNAHAFTENQTALLHHALGVKPEQRTPYRNHYLAGPGHYALPDLEALTDAGLMERGQPPSFCRQTDILFHVTDTGRTFALEHLPQPPKLTRYGEYLQHGDCFDSFADFLGINKPKVEMRWKLGHGYEYRMYRSHREALWREEFSGEWCTTKQTAKASYKAALKRRQAARHEQGE